MVEANAAGNTFLKNNKFGDPAKQKIINRSYVW